jgi:hypothetical protein
MLKSYRRPIRRSAGIPRLLIDGVGEIFSLEGRVLFAPSDLLEQFRNIRRCIVSQKAWRRDGSLRRR